MWRTYGLLILVSCLHAQAAVKLNEVFGSHMVLQQGREIPIFGTTDSPSKSITVLFDGKKVKAVTKGKKWRAVLPAMPASSEGRTLTVEQGDQSVVLEDVVVGEVWIASGQSNMLFRLNQTPGNGAAEIRKADNPRFRFYHAEPQVHTNGAAYGEKEKKALREGKMYEGQWAVCNAASVPRMSAVAYYFGQELQKQLNAPVGVVHTSLGGSQMTAWIPKETLKREYRSCLGASWLESPFVSAWVRGRAKQNIGKDRDMPHPYKPAFLFETGIAPWTQLPVAGVIWYQGESDAEIQDMSQNRKLLRDLVVSWRKAFSSPGLPFLQVQLPRINDSTALRRYWPEFRAVQAQTADEMPGVYCVTTLDLGSTDSNVHPPRKAEVGRRLADVAAAEVYGKSVGCYGPAFQSMKADGPLVTVHFNHADGLKTTDGRSPEGFELAGSNGKFSPAVVKDVQKDSLVLQAEGVQKPVAVRYGWKTYMEPNLVNDSGLPAQPFVAELRKNSAKQH